MFLLSTPLIFFSVITAFFAGFILQFIISRKRFTELESDFMGMKKKQKQMDQEYSILLQAMEGAKAQAEEMQRKLYGTNIMERTEPEDAEHFFNRQILAEFIFKQMNEATAQSDGSRDVEKPGDAQLMQSLATLDDKVVKILAEVVK